MIELPDRALHAIGFTLALAIVVFLHMVVGEMVPKNLAIAQPERTLLALSLPNAAYVAVTRPLLWLLNRIANAGVRLLGVEPRDELATVHSAEELQSMLADSRREGLIEDVAHQLLAGALTLPDRPVRSLMVGRDRIAWIARSATAAEAEAQMARTGRTRLVVCGSDLDDVLGFVHAKDLLPLTGEARHRPLPLGRVRRMLRVTPSARVVATMVAMQRARIHVALVIGAAGRPSVWPASRTCWRRLSATSATRAIRLPLRDRRVTGIARSRHEIATSVTDALSSAPIMRRIPLAVALVFAALLSTIPSRHADDDDIARARERANEAAEDLAEAESVLGRLDQEIADLEAKTADTEARLKSLRAIVRDTAVQQFVNGGERSELASYANDDLNEQVRAESLGRYATQGNQEAIDEFLALTEDLDAAVGPAGRQAGGAGGGDRRARRAQGRSREGARPPRGAGAAAQGSRGTQTSRSCRPTSS